MQATGRRPGETFLPLDVDFADDEKVARLARYTRPGEARACRDLLVQMWLYCKRTTSDGHVPAEVVGRLVYPDPPAKGTRDADRLVDCALAEHTPNGYYLPGFLKRNKSRAQLEADREHLAETGSESGSWGNHVRWHVKGGKASPSCEHCSRSGSARVPIGSTRSGRIGSDRTETETETETETASGEVRGARHVTLPASDAQKPPRCKAHADLDPDDDPGPCVGCMRARQAAERRAERQRTERAEQRAACTACDPDGWLLDDNGDPSPIKCDHRYRRQA